MGEGISLREVFGILSKHKVVILSITLFAGLLTGIVSYFILPPVYESSTEILVNQNNEVTDQNIENDLQLVGTYSDIIKNPGILSQVNEQLDLNLTLKEMEERITVATNESSQVINVSVRDNSLEQSVLIANAIVSVFSEEVKNLLNVEDVSVISAAETTNNTLPVAPNSFLNTAIASIIGLLFGTSLAFLMNYMNTTIQTDQDVETVLNIPVLAVIPSIMEKEKSEKLVEPTFEGKEVKSK